MARIISEPSHEWSAEMRCHKCDALSAFDHDDLERDGFKKDPNTYWFDGSAVSVKKYYVWCPNRCDIIFVPDERLSEQTKMYVREQGREVMT